MTRFARILVALLVATGIASPDFALAFQGSIKVERVEISPAEAEAEVGQRLQFTATGRDARGAASSEKPSAWFAAPFDIAAGDESGAFTFFLPGEVRVGAMIGGKAGYAVVRVRPAAPVSLEISPAPRSVIEGGSIRLSALARTANGDPRSDISIAWSSSDASVVSVDRAGIARGISPGRATITASVSAVRSEISIEVSPNPAENLTISPAAAEVRTGDVVSFSAIVADGQGRALREIPVHWSVNGEGATIYEDGAFVAERPGSYIVSAGCGDVIASASVVVRPRNVGRELEVVGRARIKDVQSAEQWIFGNHAYISSIADRVSVFDISNPSKPVLTHTIKVDARIVNDVSTTADGKVGVLTREGASNRRNGIVFLDTSNPAKPRMVSEYTATVTGGVHSAFIDGHYVYLTDDATGSMRVVDFRDVKKPKEVARWEVEKPLAIPVRNILGDESMGGRYLHDVQVVDGLAYLAYWRDGLVILDVGNGIKGGSPENPRFVSTLRFNYHELYGDGWLAGAHAVFRYKNYVFVGDEVFPSEFNIQDPARIPVRGIVHVVDVSDITAPRAVARYEVPEAGAHNIWVDDDLLYMGYYTGGGRILDVSGELRGDLYRQGREVARLWTGDPQGFRPNLPFTWGAQPHGDLVFFVDINTGLWIVKLGKPLFSGATSSPGR